MIDRPLSAKIYVTLLDPEAIGTLIADEVEKDYLRGPFNVLPFEKYRVRPIGLVEGKYSGKKRLIVDLSAPHDNSEHSSINDLIDKDSCSLPYVKKTMLSKKLNEWEKGRF